MGVSCEAIIWEKMPSQIMPTLAWVGEQFMGTHYWQRDVTNFHKSGEVCH